ncbi:lasso peptide biosynthesis PqqD family chaperone [Bacillus sp. V3B]|uniref:lasso peptide biosynthesis PqqD family chaperone n=1 Tax=Bacillus sp. V3B TaxID=2804915 RepID=UPI00210E723B|nr:lasso peptide biosynthesis PqqD family chaperone [Bacillus sp. V3B]MCQ6275268.1 lasso peptide biosynthesis PqqD family chaperone [Bacillus sp. V3B]
MLNTKKITLNYTVSQREGNIVSDMDGEKVMMSIQNGKYYNLGEIGGVIWDLIKAPITVNQVIMELISQYDVKENECEVEVVSFLEHLSKEGLINIENKS